MPINSNGEAAKLRNSVEPKERGALTNIFNKIPTNIKIREKFKSKLRSSISIDSPSPSTDGVSFLKSLTNNVIQSKPSIKESISKMMPSRTKTIKSDDSLDSSDLEF